MGQTLEQRYWWVLGLEMDIGHAIQKRPLADAGVAVRGTALEAAVEAGTEVVGRLDLKGSRAVEEMAVLVDIQKEEQPGWEVDTAVAVDKVVESREDLGLVALHTQEAGQVADSMQSEDLAVARSLEVVRIEL